MRVGFTGTREDTTCEQHKALCGWLRDLRERVGSPAEFHHGCCIGADAEAVDAVLTHLPGARVIAHPPTNLGWLSDSALDLSHERREAADYLVRNRDIVDACDVLLACPKGPEERRSGTWSTVRLARKLGRPVVVFWPDGTVEG
jgi:predicted Rossmann fold nucleotide-binding protein DprA/Smf involved in DNA uptake